MSILYGTKINQLLANTAPIGLLFADWLKKKGYSVQLQKKYRDSGWLTAICKGVMYRTGSRLNAYEAIASYNKQMGGTLRVAAMSALEYMGFNHYVPMGKPVLMVAAPTCKMPLWMQSDVYDATFRVFHTNAFSYVETIERVSYNGTLYVSSPEQAFLECLILAPKSYNYMDLYYVMEQLTTLRSDVVQHLLETLNNNRVKRMFLYMAEKVRHYWFEELHPERIDTGTGKIQVVANGTFNRKYNMTIPKEIEECEG